MYAHEGEYLQKYETKILIVLKKACCHFPQKNTYHAFPVFGKNVYLK